MENFLLIVVAITIGYIANKFKFLPKEAPNVLNLYALYIAFPALILIQIPKLSISVDMIIPVVISWSVMISTSLITLYVSKLFKFSKEVTGSLMLVSVLTNSSFLGIPIINAYMGESALPYILVYDQFGTFLFFAVYATFITAYFTSNEAISFKLITIKVLTFPPFLALIISLFLIGVEYHPAITHVLQSITNTIVPIVLVAVGLQLQFKLPKSDFKPFFTSLTIKLIVAPLIAFLIAYMFSWNNQAAIVSIMEAGMASMITAGAIASMAGLAPRLSTAIVGYGILISFVTTNIIYNLIT